MSAATTYQGNEITLLAAAAIAQYLLVTSAGALAGATDDAIGTAPLAIADGKRGRVRLFSAGTTLVVAGAAITKDAKVYQATGGKVTGSSAGSARLLGTALEAATADGDVIAIVPISHVVTATSVAIDEVTVTNNNLIIGNASNEGSLLATGATGRALIAAANVNAAQDVTGPGPLQGLVSEDVDDDKTLDAEDVGKIMNVTVTSKTVTLPATAIGLRYAIRCGTAGIALAVSPNASDKIMGPDLAGDNNKDRLLATGALGDYIVLVADGVDGWYVHHERGTWTAEA